MGKLNFVLAIRALQKQQTANEPATASIIEMAKYG